MTLSQFNALDKITEVGFFICFYYSPKLNLETKQELLKNIQEPTEEEETDESQELISPLAKSSSLSGSSTRFKMNSVAQALADLKETQLPCPIISAKLQNPKLDKYFEFITRIINSSTIFKEIHEEQQQQLLLEQQLQQSSSNQNNGSGVSASTATAPGSSPLLKPESSPPVSSSRRKTVTQTPQTRVSMDNALVQSRQTNFFTDFFFERPYESTNVKQARAKMKSAF